MYVCLGWRAFRELFEEVATRAGPKVGVMGENGGRTGEADRECEGEFGDWPRWDRGEVSTVRPGMVLLVGGCMEKRLKGSA